MCSVKLVCDSVENKGMKEVWSRALSLGTCGWSSGTAV